MLTSRAVFSIISKAMKNNQKIAILHKNEVGKNCPILYAMGKHGFIQGCEKRGEYFFVYLRRIYWKTWTSFTKPFNEISFIVRKKNQASISAKE